MQGGATLARGGTCGNCSDAALEKSANKRTNDVGMVFLESAVRVRDDDHKSLQKNSLQMVPPKDSPKKGAGLPRIGEASSRTQLTRLTRLTQLTQLTQLDAADTRRAACPNSRRHSAPCLEAGGRGSPSWSAGAAIPKVCPERSPCQTVAPTKFGPRRPNQGQGT